MKEHNPGAAAGNLEELEEDAGAEHAEMEKEEEIEDYREKNWPRLPQDKTNPNHKKITHRIFEQQKITTNRNHTGQLFGEVSKSEENRIVNGFEAGESNTDLI